MTTERSCSSCGCTDDRACPGGCWWAGPDLCSNCTPLQIVPDGAWGHHLTGLVTTPSLTDYQVDDIRRQWLARANPSPAWLPHGAELVYGTEPLIKPAAVLPLSVELVDNVIDTYDLPDGIRRHLHRMARESYDFVRYGWTSPVDAPQGVWWPAWRWADRIDRRVAQARAAASTVRTWAYSARFRLVGPAAGDVDEGGWCL